MSPKSPSGMTHVVLLYEGPPPRLLRRLGMLSVLVGTVSLPADLYEVTGKKSIQHWPPGMAEITNVLFVVSTQ